jgi:hypothetical protein
MFIEALLTMSKLWKQPRSPTTKKWIKKLWCLYTIEFYSATRKNEILSFVGKRMELENNILSKVSQAQKDKAACSLSCVDPRPKTNAAIFWCTGHTKGSLCEAFPCTGQEKETKNLNEINVLTEQE